MARTSQADLEVARLPFIPRHAGLLAAAVLLLAAVWIDLGPFHKKHTSDSLIFVLQSLYAWTPFEWQANRIGSLVPLLAMPFHNPFTNLLVQFGITIFLGLAAFFLAARYLAPRRSWILAGVIGASVFLVCLSHDVWRYLREVPQYAVSMALGFAALNLLSPAAVSSRLLWALRVAIAALLMLVAVWVNVSLPALLVPIIVCKAVLEWPGWPAARKRVALSSPASLLAQWPGASIVITAVAFLAVVMFAGAHAQAYGDQWGRLDLSPRHLLTAYARLAAGSVDVWLRQGHFPLALALIGSGALLTLLTAAGRRALASSLPAVACLLAGAASQYAVMGLLKWPEASGYDSRYLLPSIVLSITALAVFAAIQFMALFRDRSQQWLAAAAPFAFLLVVTSAYPAPSIQKTRAYLDDLGQLTGEVIDSGCTHVAGDYWRVWTAVYHADLVLYERGSDRRIWGVSFRSRPTMKYWDVRPLSDWRVAQAIGEDPSVATEWLGFYGLGSLSLRVEKTLKTIRVYTVEARVVRPGEYDEE